MKGLAHLACRKLALQAKGYGFNLPGRLTIEMAQVTGAPANGPSRLGVNPKGPILLGRLRPFESGAPARRRVA